MQFNFDSKLSRNICQYVMNSVTHINIENMFLSRDSLTKFEKLIVYLYLKGFSFEQLINLTIQYEEQNPDKYPMPFDDMNDLKELSELPTGLLYLKLYVMRLLKFDDDEVNEILNIRF
jgi:hypothetical protein